MILEFHSNMPPTRSCVPNSQAIGMARCSTAITMRNSISTCALTSKMAHAPITASVGFAPAVASSMEMAVSKQIKLRAINTL